MMQDFMELLKKKAKEQNGPKKDEKMEAKANMAKELSDMLAGDLTEGIKDSKKVVVSSDSEEGLKKGLEKAEDILENKMGEEESEDESEEESEDESEDKSDIESKIAELEKQLQDLKSKR